MPVIIGGSGTANGITSFSSAAAFRSNLSVTGYANVSQGLSTVSRGISNASVPSGSVLQATFAQSTTYLSTTSLAWGNTTIQASITPISSTSKILIMSGIYIECRSSSDVYNSANTRLVRDSSVIHTQTYSCSVRATASGGTAASGATCSVVYYDSPGTTSPVVYRFDGCSGTSGIQVIYNGNASLVYSPSGIILMEIAV